MITIMKRLNKIPKQPISYHAIPFSHGVYYNLVMFHTDKDKVKTVLDTFSYQLLNNIYDALFRGYGYVSKYTSLRKIAQLKQLVDWPVYFAKDRHMYIFYVSPEVFSVINSHGIHNRRKMFSDSMFEKLMNGADNARVPHFRYVLYNLQNMNYDIHHNRHFHIRKNGTITYTPKGRPTDFNGDGYWSTDGRQTISLGRALRKIINTYSHHDVVNDTDLSLVVNEVMAEYFFNGRIEIVEGDDIIKYYEESSYADDQSTLSNSCMRYSHCSEWIEFYTVNKCMMVVALDNNDKLLGRAIVWPEVNINGEKHTFMDRVYGKPLTITKILEFATEQGFVTKQQQDYHSSREIKYPNGECVYIDMSIECITNDTHTYPYMDTFKWASDLGNNRVLLSNSDGDRELTGTEGNHELTYCEETDEYVEPDDAEWSDWYNSHIPSYQSVYSDYMDDCILNRDSIRLECGSLIHCDHDDVENVILPSTSHGYAVSDDVTYGINQNGDEDQLYSGYPIGFDDIFKNYTYVTWLNTHELTLEDDGNRHVTINTVLSWDALMSKYTVTEIIDLV